MLTKRKRQAYNAYMRVYMLKRYRARRAAALKHLGGKCTECGSRKKLELDHIDRRKKSFSISKLWSVSEKRFQAELKKCQILCHPCHEEKTIAELGQQRSKVMHGTRSSFRFCHCNLCRAAHNQYCREWKRRRRESAECK